MSEKYRLFATVAGAPALEVPETISGLKAWYKADAGVTGTTPISVWADQSGNGFDLDTSPFTFPDLVAGVQNGLPVVRSGVVGDELDTSVDPWIGNYPAALTIFMLMDLGALAAASGLLFKTQGGQVDLSYNNTPKQAAWRMRAQGQSSVSVSVNFDWETSGFHLMTLVAPFGGTMVLYIDSSLSSSVSLTGSELINNSTAIKVIGTHENADIAEVIIYTEALSDSNRTAIWDYLADKWAVTI